MSLCFLSPYARRRSSWWKGIPVLLSLVRRQRVNSFAGTASRTLSPARYRLSRCASSESLRGIRHLPHPLAFHSAPQRPCFGHAVLRGDPMIDPDLDPPPEGGPGPHFAAGTQGSGPGVPELLRRPGRLSDTAQAGGPRQLPLPRSDLAAG